MTDDEKCKALAEIVKLGEQVGWKTEQVKNLTLSFNDQELKELVATIIFVKDAGQYREDK